MGFETIRFELDGKTGILTIDRPDAMNALNSKVFDEINELLDDIGKRSDVKGLIITGSGKAFVAGADISEMKDMNGNEAEKFSKKGQRTFDRIESIEMPVIAAVNGFALGGGCELAMACDIRIAGTRAKFGQPEVNLGLIPGFAGTQRLPRLIGLGNALLLLMSAEMTGAEDALKMGLVQRVTEQDDLMTETKKLMELILSKGPNAVKLIKKTVREGFDVSFREGSDLEASQFASLFGNEGTVGMKAFLEKRKPEWEDK